jgi:replicative DNA helicase
VNDLTKAKFETELMVVGAMLLEPRAIAGITEILSFDDFTSSDLSIIFQNIVMLWERGAEITPSSVAAELPESTANIVWDAYSGTGSAVSATWYAEKVKEAATRRELAARCRQLETTARKEKMDVSDLLAQAITRMYEIQHTDAKTTISEDLAEIQRMSQEAAKSKYGTVGVPTGYQSLDDVTGGLRNQDLITIAARPSIGKTALATNIFQNIIEQTDLKAMFFSGEMSRHQLLLRMASRRARIDNNALARGNLSPADWSQYTDVCGELALLMDGRAWINDKSRPSPGHVRALAKQRMQSSGLDVIFVDYLQIMSVKGGGTDRVQQLSIITGAMKAIAKDLEIPVVLLSQINRGGEIGNEIREPGLSDLKGSGSIEEDSDLVIFVHRSDRRAFSGKLIIGKHRNGPLDVIPVTYEGHLTSFKEK